uniref:14 kDa component of binary insecticidal crystal protein n=1 Tax=Bacillus thuringiensis TaxID=1428 RepID=Q5GGS6_BACTU|nr:14 kDa component of binary insecticidal crystal protein [Bacillus thuringiensis]
MSAREVHIEIINHTGHTLQMDKRTRLAHGEWIITPVNVPNNSSDLFQAGSDGVLTGVEGIIIYTINGEIEIPLHFDNPYAGSNKYSGRSSDDDYKVITEARAEHRANNHDHVTYTVQRNISRYTNKLCSNNS